jgi:hypothetical protein
MLALLIAIAENIQQHIPPAHNCEVQNIPDMDCDSFCKMFINKPSDLRVCTKTCEKYKEFQGHLPGDNPPVVKLLEKPPIDFISDNVTVEEKTYYLLTYVSVAGAIVVSVFFIMSMWICFIGCSVSRKIKKAIDEDSSYEYHGHRY